MEDNVGDKIKNEWKLCRGINERSIRVLSRIKPSSTCGEYGVVGCKSRVSGGNQKATTDQYNYRDECFHLMHTVYLSRAT